MTQHFIATRNTAQCLTATHNTPKCLIATHDTTRRLVATHDTTQYLTATHDITRRLIAAHNTTKLCVTITDLLFDLESPGSKQSLVDEVRTVRHACNDNDVMLVTTDPSKVGVLNLFPIQYPRVIKQSTRTPNKLTLN